MVYTKSRCILFLICFLTFHYIKAENERINEIDSLINIAEWHYIRMNVKELLYISNEEIIPKSNQYNYKKGLSLGNFYLASYFFFTRDYKNSLKYIKKSQMYLSGTIDNQKQYSRNYGLMGDCYRELNIYTLSKENYNLSLKYVKKIKNKSMQDWLVESSSYSAYSILYEQLNQYDSVYYYLNKEKNILSKFPEKKIFIQKGYSNLGLANYHFLMNDLDSAKYYNMEALKLYSGKKIGDEITALIGLGDISLQEKKIIEAEKFYLNAIRKCVEYNDNYSKGEIYKKISLVYIKLERPEEADKYLKLSNNYQDSLKFSLDMDRNIILNSILIKKYDTTKKYIFIVFCAFFIFSLLFFLFFRKNREWKKINEEKIEYIDKLELKLKVPLDDVINQAKNNHPLFFETFQMLYPEFRSRLLAINNTLTPNDLILLAYIYLNISSKDIAHYTFRSYRTIQTRKYMLRKKLALKKEEDLYLWLKNIC